MKKAHSHARSACRFVLSAILLPMCAFVARAQAPAIQWQKTYGGTGADGANSIRQTPDGGYITGGYTSSINGDVSGNHGGSDCWVVKTSATGAIQWQKALGGSGFDQVDQVKVDVNGGYIIAGYTESNDGQVTGNHGGGDAWVVKLNDTGGIVWQKVMGGTGLDFFNSVRNTADSGYIFVGGAGANGGDVSGFQGGGLDVWVTKISKTGAVSWSKCYGGPGYELSFDVTITNSNGFVIVATASANGGQVTGHHGGLNDTWILSLDDTGRIQWAKTYGGTADDRAYSVSQLSNGTFLIGGTSNSVNGDVSNNHGGYDYWAICLDDTGRAIWNNSYGGFGNEIVNQGAATFDSGAILSGYTISTDGQVTGNHGSNDIWLVKINSLGTLQWEKTLGGTLGDTAFSVIQAADSGYVVAGTSASTNGDVTTNHGSEDLWVVKLNSTTAVSVVSANPAIKVYPSVTTGAVTIEMPAGYEQASIRLVNMAGAEFATPADKGRARKLQLSDVPSGIYILQVLNNNELSTYRIINNP